QNRRISGTQQAPRRAGNGARKTGARLARAPRGVAKRFGGKPAHAAIAARRADTAASRARRSQAQPPDRRSAARGQPTPPAGILRRMAARAGTPSPRARRAPGGVGGAPAPATGYRRRTSASPPGARRSPPAPRHTGQGMG